MTNSGIPMTGGQRQTCRDADARAVGAAWGEADASADRPAKSDAEIIALAAQEVDGELGGWQEAAAIRGYRRAYASSEVR